MTATPSIDVSAWLDEQLAQASPDLLRAMVSTFAQALMSGCRGCLWGRLRGAQRTAHQHPQRLPGSGVGHPRRQYRAGDPEAAQGSYFLDWLLEHRRLPEAATRRSDQDGIASSVGGTVPTRWDGGRELRAPDGRRPGDRDHRGAQTAVCS